MLSATLILFVTWMWFKSGLSIWCLVFAWVLWLLDDFYFIGDLRMKKAEYRTPSRKDGKAWDFKWLLEESKWYAIKTNRKEKKFLKDSLTRSYRRKQRQGKLDAEQEQE